MRGFRLYVVGLGLSLAIAASVFVPSTFASRNTSGTYSLPSGNPVTSGTTITSSWANNTLNDLATEVTNSLDRQGRGAMTAPLQHSTGSCAAPSVTFSADSDVGFWRSTTNEMAACVATNSTQTWTTTGAKFPMRASTQAGLTATQSTSNADAINATGNGFGNGIFATGGTTSGLGVVGIGGAPNGQGVKGQGTGTASGGYFVGGATNAAGIYTIGGGTTGVGIYAEHAAGVSALNPAAQFTGNLYMTGGNPASTAGFSNTLTDANIPKAWGLITCATDGSGCAVTKGFNVSSVTNSGSAITVHFATGFDSTSYAVVITSADNSSGANAFYRVASRTSSTFVLGGTYTGGGAADLVTGGGAFSFLAFGFQ